MLFNSLHFLAFFPIVTLLYFLLPAGQRWLVLLVASFYFYMVWRPAFVLLILLTVTIDYVAAMLLVRTASPGRRKLLLASSITANMGILAYFKYTNFALDSVRAASDAMGLGWTIPVYDIILPIGISFHTFQSVGYAIDVYRGVLRPEHRYPRFALFVMFFPQLVAGPIERAPRLLTQLQKPTEFDYDRAAEGIKRIVWGMFKKVVIADRLAGYVNVVYGDPARFDGVALTVATYFFAFQIYADFSAYSDIALGSARVLGFDLMENFRRPYFARSVEEFWRRWHISLSTWFRDYLYIPLGGNRLGGWRTHVNIFIVFLISGLWHGSNWTYVVWGALHGTWIVAGRLAQRIPWQVTAPAWAQRVWTFHLALLAWVFFRIGSVGEGIDLLVRAATDVPRFVASLPGVRDFYDAAIAPVLITPFDFATAVALVGFLLAVEWGMEQGWFAGSRRARPWLERLWYDGLAVGCLLLGVFGKHEFIYFQF